MAPVTGSAPLSGDQYIAPLAKLTYRTDPSPDASGDVGAPSALASPPIDAHLAKMAPPRRVSARSCGPGGVLKCAAISRSRGISAYAALPGHSVMPTSRCAKMAGRVATTPWPKLVNEPPAEVRVTLP